MGTREIAVSKGQKHHEWASMCGEPFHFIFFPFSLVYPESHFKLLNGLVTNAWRKTPVSSFNTTSTYTWCRGMGPSFLHNIMKKHHYRLHIFHQTSHRYGTRWPPSHHHLVSWSSIWNPPPTLLIGVSACFWFISFFSSGVGRPSVNYQNMIVTSLWGGMSDQISGTIYHFALLLPLHSYFHYETCFITLFQNFAYQLK